MTSKIFQCSHWVGMTALWALCSAPMAWGANYPCSGSKDGVAHCQGERFVCNDGSISGSKKVCSAPNSSSAAPAARGLIRSSATPGDCSCRSAAVCTGPRGGRYCLSDSGRKSYLRH